jgi:hypothetical protein
MLIGVGRDDREVRHREHLPLAPQLLQLLRHDFRHRASHAAVDLVEHERRLVLVGRAQGLQRQHDARALAA